MDVDLVGEGRRKPFRYPPPPPGKIYIRDKAASRARLVAEAIHAYEASSQEVPEYLAVQPAGTPENEAQDDIVLVDSDFPPPLPPLNAPPEVPAEE